MKKLKAEEKKDQQNPERKLENKHEVLSSNSYFNNLIQLQLTPVSIGVDCYNRLIVQHNEPGVFHPPAFL
ncbi:MAG: hypothetical protein ACM3VS_19145 [Candidatus Dadabacteria bacterium]